MHTDIADCSDTDIDPEAVNRFTPTPINVCAATSTTANPQKTPDMWPPYASAISWTIYHDVPTSSASNCRAIVTQQIPKCFGANRYTHADLFINYDQMFSRFSKMEMKYCFICVFPSCDVKTGGGERKLSILQKQETAGATSWSRVVSRERTSTKRVAISSPREATMPASVFLVHRGWPVAFFPFAQWLSTSKHQTCTCSTKAWLFACTCSQSVEVWQRMGDKFCVCVCGPACFPLTFVVQWSLCKSVLVSFGVLFVGLQWKPHWEPRLHVAI